MSPQLTIVSDEVSQDLPVVAGFLREFGLNSFELRSMFGRAFKDLTAADLAEIRRTARGEGWRIAGCATPVFKCELGDAAGLSEHIEIFRRSLDVARELDCRLLRVFTFLRRPVPLDGATVRRIADHLRPLCDLAAAAGVKVGIENEASCLVGTPEESADLCTALAHPEAGIIWDPCNVLYIAEADCSDLAASYLRLARHVIHVHAKDAVRTPGDTRPAKAAPLGAGEVGWARQLAALRQSGYAGLISLETHWRKNAALDETTLHLPAGYGFSAGGEEASRICLKALDGLLAV